MYLECTFMPKCGSRIFTENKKYKAKDMENIWMIRDNYNIERCIPKNNMKFVVENRGHLGIVYRAKFKEAEGESNDCT